MPKMDTGLTAADIFSGCGGLTVGLRRAQFRVVGAVEIDEVAADSYRLNHSDVHLWQSDVREISGRLFLRKLGLKKGELDLLAGCPPCQGFSSIRTLNGGRTVRDERNDLIFEFGRLIAELNPKTVMMENVPGLASDQRLTKFVRELEHLGFQVVWNVLDTADYAVPQRRKRLILLASRLGAIDFAKPARTSRTVRMAIGGLARPGKTGDRLHDMPENRAEHVRQLIRLIPRNGGSRRDLPLEMQLPCHQRCRGFSDVYGRMAWDEVSPTITTGCFNPSKGRFLHPTQNRNITMREAALLQSFPRSYRFPIEAGKQRIAALIGNALPPEFIRRHARTIARHLNAQ